MVILELRELHEVLDRKVQTVQREFTTLQERLSKLRRMWSEEEETERPKIIEEQNQLRERQGTLAEEVNLWRDRIRSIEVIQGELALQKTLQELENCGDAEIAEAVREARLIMAMTPEEKAARFQKNAAAVSDTPAGRLLERGRTTYDLRHDGAAALQKAAVEFANRSNIALDDAALAEVEAGCQHKDPIVAELALRAVVQILRFRALRSAEISVSHPAVEKLAQLRTPLVIPVLAEVLATARTGYVDDGIGTREEPNTPDRLAALIALVEHWRTPESETAIRRRMQDPNQQLADAAERAIQAFPTPWTVDPPK